ncbi:MAG: response regulator transcription factor [Chloroflexota bacterium]
MSAARILLVESKRAKRTSFADDLRKRYEVILAFSGKQALEVVKDAPPSVIVLDALSMRSPGGRICQTLRKGLPGIPLIHLHPGPKSKAASVADVVLYMPFTSRKLVNNIERLLDVPDDSVIVCGPFSVHRGRRVLIANGQESQLTPKLAQLVEVFMRNPGQTLDRRFLMERVWNTDYLGDTRTLDVHIRWIRRAIEANPSKPQYLKTVRGVGYRLDIPEPEASPKTPDTELIAN